MKFSPYVDIFVQNSGCFSYDHYIHGLRNYIKASLLTGALGELQLAPISADFVNKNPLALLLGETNRMNARYFYIHDLLSRYENSDSFNFRNTLYFEKLYEPYRDKNLAVRFRGRREIKRKTDRVLKIFEWLRVNDGDYGGVSAFIKGRDTVILPSDYPLCISLNEGKSLSDYVQLDGSHRRCVSAYAGYTEVPCLVAKLGAVEEFIEKNNPPYFEEHRQTFFSLIEKTKVLNSK